MPYHRPVSGEVASNAVQGGSSSPPSVRPEESGSRTTRSSSTAGPYSIRPPEDEPVVDLERVLLREEVVRSRVFFKTIAGLSLATAAFIPVLSGETWLRALAGILCGTVAVVAGSVVLVLRKPERYTPDIAAAVAALIGTVGVVIIYYVGLFSAGAMVLALGIYFFGMSHSRLVARTTYAVVGGLYLVASAGVAADVLPDLSLFSTSNAAPITRWFQVLMSQLIFGCSFYLARSSRRATESAVDEVNLANSEIMKQHALLNEARGELDRALSPGEGRHTGDKLGDYTLGPLLGRGAMGEVYRGESSSGQPVAVKLLHPNLVENPEHIKRFLREAEAAGAVKSSYVPAVYDVGWSNRGVPYLAMELMEGHDLGWHLRRKGRLDLKLVVEMCEHVASALCAVREAGIVHRDLKPGNLFLTDSIPRTWKVLDFGLSKILHSGSSLTKDVAVGTPSYMSPEQIRGPKVDHVSDLYALAAIAYRALTGTPTFSGDEIAHVLYRVLYSQPPNPNDFVRIPVDVELVLAVGLAKSREERFERAEDFASALRAAANGQLGDDVRQRGWALLKAAPWGSSSKPTGRAGGKAR